LVKNSAAFLEVVDVGEDKAHVSLQVPKSVKQSRLRNFPGRICLAHVRREKPLIHSGPQILRKLRDNRKYIQIHHRLLRSVSCQNLARL
jgi:hypothetical protein